MRFCVWLMLIMMLLCFRFEACPLKFLIQTWRVTMRWVVVRVWFMVVKLFHWIEAPFKLLPFLCAPLMAVVVAIRCVVENVRLVHKSLLLLFYLPLLLNKNKANYCFIFLDVKQYSHFCIKCSHFTHDVKKNWKSENMKHYNKNPQNVVRNVLL